MARRLAEGISDVALTAAYRAAILLTGSARLAEGAVVRAIESMDVDAATSEELLRLTVIASMKIMPSTEQPESRASGEPLLPVELQNVLKLPNRLRQSFVLRVLLAMPRDFSAQLLDINVSTLDRSTGLAAQTLAQWSLRRRRGRNEAENGH
jgi:DNA-directed RNA polymerase specialized sigma24 family protein